MTMRDAVVAHSIEDLLDNLFTEPKIRYYHDISDRLARILTDLVRRRFHGERTLVFAINEKYAGGGVWNVTNALTYKLREFGKLSEFESWANEYMLPREDVSIILTDTLNRMNRAVEGDFGEHYHGTLSQDGNSATIKRTS